MEFSIWSPQTHNYNGKLNERYQQYLADKYMLATDETDQYAFRLGKEIGLSKIDSIYFPVSFDPKQAEAYANYHGQNAVWDAALDGARTLVERLNNVLAHGTMLELSFICPVAWPFSCFFRRGFTDNSWLTNKLVLFTTAGNRS